MGGGFQKGNQLWKLCKNKKVTEETRRKLSISLQNHIVTKKTREKISKKRKELYKTNPEKFFHNFKKGVSSWSKGLNKNNDIRILHLSEALIGHKGAFLGKKRPEHSEKLSGEKCHWWKGGKSFEPYSKEFNKLKKEKIRNKYNYICFICKKQFNQSYYLNIHHIDYNKKNNEDINLIPLCRKCHPKTNDNREDWKNYFKEELNARQNKSTLA